MPCDPMLVHAYAENILLALSHEQTDAAGFLAQHLLKLLAWVQPAHQDAPFSYSVALDAGLSPSRRINEDYAFAASFHVQSPSSPLPLPVGLFVVADGMGGHANGALASRLAVHTLVDFLLPAVRNGQIKPDRLPEVLTQGVERANQALYQENVRRGAKGSAGKMGTAISAALCLGEHLCLANVGDCRGYLLRQQTLRQITRDHSLVAQMVSEGTLRPEEIYTHPQRNVIYRSLGQEKEVMVDTFVLPMYNGDTILLCTDGIWEMIPDERQIEQILATDALSCEERARRLVHQAKVGGGLDNIGALVMQAQFATEDLLTLLLPESALASGTYQRVSI